MKPNKSASVEHLLEIERFEANKTKLLTKSFTQHLKKPLAYWALTSDKRLPLALIGRTLGEILNTPFDEISKTPGVGQKKISSLVQLLARAAATAPADLTKEGDLLGDGSAKPKSFSAAGVSEVVWEKWRSNIVKQGYGKELLGRFAPRLRDVTKVIWNMPLESYTGYTLEQLRKKKTHGEKRVRAILETFHALHTVIAGIGSQGHLAVQVVPRRIGKVEQWIAQTLQASTLPDEKTLFEQFTGPLLEQIHDDATEQIAALADIRLGVLRDGDMAQPAGRSMSSVRQIARELGLTRARVYQLLNEINEIMAVRWPTGRHQVYELRHRLLSEVERVEPARDMRQFKAAIELFYPGTRRGANGPRSISAIDDDDDDNKDDDGPDTAEFRSRQTESNLAGLSM